MKKLPENQQDWLEFARLVARIAKTMGQAEDFLQSAFVKLLSYPYPVENAAGFVLATSRNLVIDDIRRQRIEAEGPPIDDILDIVPSNYPRPDEVYAARKRLREVMAAIDALPSRTRRIFLMHRLDGVKYREIARREEISVSAVEKHIAKAVLFIADYQERCGGDE